MNCGQTQCKMHQKMGLDMVARNTRTEEQLFVYSGNIPRKQKYNEHIKIRSLDFFSQYKFEKQWKVDRFSTK